MHHPARDDHGTPARLLAAASFLLIASSFCGALQAQPQKVEGASAGIYTCTDARGRTLTADRPIAECSDREQRELNPSGSVRRKVEPTYTARELQEREDRAREAAIQAARLTDERRRERALLVRYPNLATHDRERSEALAQIDAVTQAAKKRIAELGEDRKKIDEELEFYKQDVSKAPGAVRRKLDDNTQSVAVQNRFIAEQEEEKKRVNARFDEERTRLKTLWTPQNGGNPR
ncbi:DUF4124 domain-containing protein [Variovorax sp. NFACC27]|uniref:DUF4124 domain-containing protein n=1 Tax=unclassified Variovorax TaxID=663243 RepID=UPI00089AEEEA|nr:DUF4124 domain-containing protein [Variovorax sp. YR750]SEF25709.1 protein of unknown function [Variovorax sp. NFACC28]SEG45511.1 protein of unknown function [Variovorax sp. NFACC29]SFC27741.1 protein of unknown function [Variovorax sp. NFACC26]SFG61929.1 protein of unknown function [Variovorax sp. NFACC27]SEM22957.1 protein of unknown function [Variovorax sp. YR750]